MQVLRLQSVERRKLHQLVDFYGLLVHRTAILPSQRNRRPVRALRQGETRGRAMLAQAFVGTLAVPAGEEHVTLQVRPAGIRSESRAVAAFETLQVTHAIFRSTLARVI